LKLREESLRCSGAVELEEPERDEVDEVSDD
jgi:hypothetical protein